MATKLTLSQLRKKVEGEAKKTLVDWIDSPDRFDGVTLAKLVRETVEQAIHGATLSAIGIERVWGRDQFEVKRAGPLYAQITARAEREALDLIPKFALDERELAQLRKSYRRQYLDTLGRCVEDIAATKATEDAERIVEKVLEDLVLIEEA